MASPDWETIKQIFSEALNVPAAVRGAYLERACDGRADVYRAVSELLRAHSDASQSFLEPDSIVVRAAWLFAAGERVAGRFRVVKPIARGAMGEVYQVHDERLRLDIALKAIRPELLGDTESVERFRREVLVTRDIAHDGLCRVFDLVEHPMPPATGFPAGTVVPCLTMQLLEGINLEDWLAAHRPMRVEEALPLVRQIADALQVLHGAGIVHRDLKPSNVMLVPAGGGMRAVLTDFGLAKPLEEGLFETQRAVHGGAPFFMAPELFKGERPSRASDIYALGLLIDEMVTTSRAFSADSLHSLLMQKLGEGPSPPSARSTALPRAWEQTIMRCLAADPRDRFESAQAVLSGLAGGNARRGVRAMIRRRLKGATSLPSARAASYIAAGALVLTGVMAIREPLVNPPPTPVVIQPFKNLTSNPELEYLAIGTAGELRRRLSRVNTVRVYTPTDAREAASGTYLVQGDIQQIEAVLRITVELTNPADGTLLWSQRFDDQPGNALQLQDQLAAETVGALTRQSATRTSPFHRTFGLLAGLFPPSRPAVPQSGTSSSAAFDLYLRGRTLFEERTLPTALKAIEYLQRAVREDPNYAAAYATLADVQGVLMDSHYAPHSTLLEDAERYADQAVALDPEHPDVQLSMAAVRQAQWRWGEAEAAYKRAIELHPTFARAHRWYGGLLLQFGRFDEGLALYRKALDLDPYDFPSQSAYGHALFNADRAHDAERHLEWVLTQKDLPNAHALLGQVYAYRIRQAPDRAAEYLKKALDRSELLRQKAAASASANEPTSWNGYADLVAALAWSYSGSLDQAAAFVERLAGNGSTGAASSPMLARVYAVQGNAPAAMAALLEAERQRDRELLYINVSPHYAPIRHDAQFRALVERLGLSR